MMELSTREGYALWSGTYDEETNALIVVEERAVDALLSALPPISDALDVGVGTGRHAIHLARRGTRVVGVDPSPEMLALARGKAEREGLNIRLVEGTAGDILPLGEKSFGLVMSALVLCHLPDLSDAAGNLVRMLRPGGYLLITDFHPDMLAIGLRTSFRQEEQTYTVANTVHTREAYLDALRRHGLRLMHVEDIPLNAAADYLGQNQPVEDLLRQHGDKGFCLVILAQRPSA